MSKFRVDIYQTVYESATLEIEAENEEAAIEIAKHEYKEAILNWRFDVAGDLDFEVERMER